MRFSALILFVSLCVATSSYGIDNAPTEKMERTFTAQGDVTGDGIKETLSIHITGASINSPFTWELTILGSSGKTIYSIKRNDAWLDKFFSDDGYVTNCSGYLTCKEKYYFSELPDEIFGSLKPSTEAFDMDEFRLKNLKATAGAYLGKQGVNSAKINEAILEMQKTISTPPYFVLQVPLSAVQSEPPMIWVKCLDRFVPYYQE